MVEVSPKKVEEHVSGGKNAYREFVDGMRDTKAKAAIAARIARLRAGNRGDWGDVGEGVFELRIHVGAGYRVYCGEANNQLVILVGAGSKSTQDKDIKKAHAAWANYKVGK